MRPKIISHAMFATPVRSPKTCYVCYTSQVTFVMKTPDTNCSGAVTYGVGRFLQLLVQLFYALVDLLKLGHLGLELGQHVRIGPLGVSDLPLDLQVLLQCLLVQDRLWEHIQFSEALKSERTGV